MTRCSPTVVSLALAWTSACAHPRGFAESERPTCLVLSAGRADALAQLGAVQAVQEAGLEIDCVAGTEMGAVVASLYAAAPAKDPVVRYRALMSRYSQKRGLADLLAALLLAGWQIDVTGAGEDSTNPMHGRHDQYIDAVGIFFIFLEFAETYERFLEISRIEDLPLDFVAFHIHATAQWPAIVPVTTGPIHIGLLSSLTTMVTFDETELAGPGRERPLGRLAAVPVEETCARFPRHRLLAINVTDSPALMDEVRCPTLEVELDLPAPTERADLETFLLGHGPTFERHLATARRATADALQGVARTRPPY
jgi:hypothetical protein